MAATAPTIEPNNKPKPKPDFFSAIDKIKKNF
jgi:hypothetical protein